MVKEGDELELIVHLPRPRFGLRFGGDHDV